MLDPKLLLSEHLRIVGIVEVLSNDCDESYFASSAAVLDTSQVVIRRVISSAAMRSGQKQDRDGDCDDYNKQRIDAALYGGSVGVDFWGHGVERGVLGFGRSF